MLTNERIRRTQLIREAEGYLDLIGSFQNQWTLDESLCRPLAERALESLNQIQSPQGFKPQILFLKGEAHRILGHFAQAVNLFEQSLRIDPENLPTFWSLAVCYRRLEQTESSVEVMRAAIVADAENATNHYELARYMALLSDVRAASRHLAVSIDLDPRLRDTAVTDPDFDGIRDQSEFQAVLSITV
ncbi:MAG TPA: tetratricopeptide repeat protein [Pirellulaceae bacterium]|nr:tetratricopeptide repeat protein [Pirellulaceae bacterium]